MHLNNTFLKELKMELKTHNYEHLLKMLKDLSIGRNNINGIDFVKIQLNEEYRDHGASTSFSVDAIVLDDGSIVNCPYGCFVSVDSCSSSEKIIDFCKIFKFIPRHTIEEFQRIDDSWMFKRIYLSGTKKENYPFEVKLMRNDTIPFQELF